MLKFLGGKKMNSKISFYRCERCGNIVVLIKNGGGTLKCCGEPMKLLTANTSDGAHEKHVPVAVKANGEVKVHVGSIEHPMIDAHYIQWIALVTDNNVELTYLHPGDRPHVTFKDKGFGEVYEYCNLHGLWKVVL